MKKAITHLFNTIYKHISIPAVPAGQKEDFSLHKLHENNFRILVIAAFLFFEQFIYGLFVSSLGSMLQIIYISTSVIMLQKY